MAFGKIKTEGGAEVTRSPLIWFGGKSKYAEYIISKFPEHKKYVEPFGGAAHVIAQKERKSHEVYNDIDGEVVNFLMMVRDYPGPMEKACDSLPYSRELYEKWKHEPLPEDSFDRAVRWFYMNRSGITNGNVKVGATGWAHSMKSGQPPSMNYISACKLFESFSERLKGVLIENSDFRKVIEKYDDEEGLFYVDPPYVGRENRYAGGFTEKDHRDLSEMLHKVKAKVVLSYYEDPLIDELYTDWYIEKFKTFKQAVGGDGLGSEAEELLLMNFNNGQLTLF